MGNSHHKNKNHRHHGFEEEEIVEEQILPADNSNKNSSTIRQRKNGQEEKSSQSQNSNNPVITRKFYYKHEYSSSDSEQDVQSGEIDGKTDNNENATSKNPHTRHRHRPKAPPHNRLSWLRRRHFFLFSLVTVVLSAIAIQHSDQPLTDYLPEELQSRWHTMIGDSTRPGLIARDAGIHAHFPIVLIPGIISTALEVWEGELCARPHFRQRLWGSALMIRSMLLDTRCWMRHMMLDANTGLDPPGIKLRPSSGIEAADYFIGGFWVWAKIIENFADIGYDTNSMMMAPFDWRLSLKHLQVRDFYYSKLKAQIELAKLSNQNRKVVLISHSMGANVIHYFLKWVESPEGGNAGDNWVNDHIETIVNIGGPQLGVAKSWSALFSGEMKDTAELAPFLDYWRQRVVFSQADVIQMMRAIFSVPSMMPKGGDAIWGDENGAPDDYFCEKYVNAARLLMNKSDDVVSNSLKSQTEAEDQFDSMISSIEPERTTETHNNANPGHGDVDIGGDGESDELKVARSGHGVGQSLSEMFEDSVLRHPSRWFNSHQSRQAYNSTRDSDRGLFVTFQRRPNENTTSRKDECLDHCDMTLDGALEEMRRTAPQYMKFIESFYSFGFNPSASQNESKYWSNPLESPLPKAPNLKIYCLYGVGRETERGYFYRHQVTGTEPENSLVPHWSINTTHSNDSIGVRSGVKFSDGDGTVPLISLGYMCVQGWKHPHLNPGNVTVITREYLEVNATIALLRAATSTDHVDIMGNSEIIADLLRIAGVRRKNAGEDDGKIDEEQKNAAREKRRIDLEQENAGRKKEEKGPKSEKEKKTEQGKQQSKGKPENDECDKKINCDENHSDDDKNNKWQNIADNLHEIDEKGDWTHTYHQVKDRILSCIREISQIADKRVRKKLLEHGKKVNKE